MNSNPPPNRPPAARWPPAIRHCPVCGIAMQASKSREDLAEFDTFRCQRCETTISAVIPAPPGGTRR